jgi:hypothetical protein
LKDAYFGGACQLKLGARFSDCGHAIEIELKPSGHIAHMPPSRINLNQFLMAVNSAHGGTLLSQTLRRMKCGGYIQGEQRLRSGAVTLF